MDETVWVLSIKLSGNMSGKTVEKIIELIQQQTLITIPEMALIIGVTERSVERNIQQLQYDKKLKRVGPAKGGCWEIINGENLIG